MELHHLATKMQLLAGDLNANSEVTTEMMPGEKLFLLGQMRNVANDKRQGLTFETCRGRSSIDLTLDRSIDIHG